MEGAAQTILSNAGQLLSEEYRLLRRVSGEVIELRDDLDTMNALLRMQSEAEDGAVDHFVRGWMKQLRELAYDSEDCIDLYKLRIKSRADDGVRAWLERLLGTLFLRRRLAREIGALRARAVAISERHARYGVNRDALRRSATFAPPVLASASASVQALRRANDPEQQQVVAIKDQADVLAKRVKASVEEDRHLKVFSIVGTKDVDRSTLAVEVCRRLEAEFPFQAMVKVSQAFKHSKDLKPLLKQVLEQVAKSKTENEGGIRQEGALGDMDSLDVDQLAKKLEEGLKDKRYLIVLDDVCTITSYEVIRYKLPENNCDSRIIVTTPMVEAVANANSYIHDVEAQKSGHTSHQFIGIGSQVKSLVDRLEKEEGGLKVFSVVGFGGLGKTTLAIEVCRRLEEAFPLQAMVSVSQAFEASRDLKPLLKHMLEQVVKPKTVNERGIKEEGSLSGIDKLDEDGLAKKLKESLQDNRYLIVIDDVWTIRAWDAIQSILPENNKGSRIIVTTRIETVAKSCSPDSDSGNYIHRMEPLNPNDSKKLFVSRVFGSEHASCPKELEDVMGNILDKCGDLPLAIVSIASILAGYKTSGSKDKWITVCNSIGSQIESNHTLEGLKHMVTLSYNHLPHELKTCMMYLSIFPEDYEINKDRVLSRWIAEGLVLEKRGLTQMEVAESYLEELLSRNMIQPVRFGYDGKVECFRVHDMLLEVMVSMSLECNFVSLLGGQYATMSYGRIRRLSIQGDDNDRRPQGTKQHSRKGAGRGIQGMDVQHVRSLSMFQRKGQKLLDDLGKFTLLRVLDVQDCEDLTNDHMGSVCKLYLLRFLSVKGTNITDVPPQVGKLEHLQTFDASDTGIAWLPETVTKLDKLERLHLYNKNDWMKMWNLPRGLKKMKALRKLTWVILGNDVQVAQEMSELEQLEEIIFYIDSDKINLKGNEKEITTELAKSLSRLYSLRRLTIVDKGYNRILNFLHHLPSPPRLLRHLKIGGYIDGGIPSWVQSLTYLVSFWMSWAGLVDDELYGVLCKLPNLKSIQIEYECYNDHKLLARTIHNFPSLVNLKVISDSENPKVFEFQTGSMPKLETLHINFDHKESIVGIENLTNLKEVQLTGNKNNTALGRALDQLKAESRRRSNQFQVTVRY